MRTDTGPLESGPTIMARPWMSHEFAERTQCASPHFLFWTFFDRFVDSTPQNMTIYAVFRPQFATLFEYLNDFLTYKTISMPFDLLTTF